MRTNAQNITVKSSAGETASKIVIVRISVGVRRACLCRHDPGQFMSALWRRVHKILGLLEEFLVVRAL